MMRGRGGLLDTTEEERQQRERKVKELQDRGITIHLIRHVLK